VPPSFITPELFFAMFFGVSRHSILGVLSGVNYVAPCGMSMVGRLFVMSGIVMFGGFPVVMSGMCQMFRRLLVMLCGFLRHRIFLHYILKFRSKDS
jgi:hypothetical protein